jgi:hypothetical protein
MPTTGSDRLGSVPQAMMPYIGPIAFAKASRFSMKSPSFRHRSDLGYQFSNRRSRHFRCFRHQFDYAVNPQRVHRRFRTGLCCSHPPAPGRSGYHMDGTSTRGSACTRYPHVVVMCLPDHSEPPSEPIRGPPSGWFSVHARKWASWRRLSDVLHRLEKRPPGGPSWPALE